MLFDIFIDENYLSNILLKYLKKKNKKQFDLTIHLQFTELDVSQGLLARRFFFRNEAEEKIKCLIKG